MMVVMVEMVWGKKQDHGTGRLALRLQEEDFWVVQLSQPGKERGWQLKDKHTAPG